MQTVAQSFVVLDLTQLGLSGYIPGTRRPGSR
jgi:hypothetical protein